MKHPVASILGLAVVAGISLVSPALAVVSMVYVPIGNAGNAGDTTGYGSVGYAYNIGKYEVTNAQYVEFLNAKGSSNTYGIYNSYMGSRSNIIQSGSAGGYTYSVNSTYANNAVVDVTWFDAARFCNWLANGQGNGSTETGAYTLISGQTTGIVTVNPGAQVYIPSENEWYKAAYYNGGNSTYSIYPNGKSTVTTAEANYNGIGMKDVGFGGPSAYGTYGQGGNAAEWNDAVISYSSSRGLRGGSWGDDVGSLAASYRNSLGPSVMNNSVGFRVASAIPEPTPGVLAILAGGMMLIRRKR